MNKKIIVKLLITLSFIFYFSSFDYVLADAWVLWWDWITEEKIRKWDIHTDDIPNIIKWAINFFMWIAWTIAVVFVIIWAYQILFIWAIEQNRTKWKETIIMALTWFAIAALSWTIIRFIIDNFI